MHGQEDCTKLYVLNKAGADKQIHTQNLPPPHSPPLTVVELLISSRRITHNKKQRKVYCNNCILFSPLPFVFLFFVQTVQQALQMNQEKAFTV